MTCNAFVLGGGGLLGAAEAGIARALLEAGVRPDLVCGTSIGAIREIPVAPLSRINYVAVAIRDRSDDGPTVASRSRRARRLERREAHTSIAARRVTYDIELRNDKPPQRCRHSAAAGDVRVLRNHAGAAGVQRRPSSLTCTFGSSAADRSDAEGELPRACLKQCSRLHCGEHIMDND